MNIALINSEYPSLSRTDHGGIATYTYCMANALAAAGQNVFVLAKEGTLPDSLDNRVTFCTFRPVAPPRPVQLLERIAGDRIYQARCYSRGLVKRINEICVDTPLDIVEIPEYNALASLVPRKAGYQTIIHLHTPSEIVARFNATQVSYKERAWFWFENHTARIRPAIVSPSQSLRHIVAKCYSRSEATIVLLPHPMDVHAFTRLPWTVRDPDRIEIVFSGRLERRKGAEILRDALPLILDLDPRIHLTFAGETEIGESRDYRIAIERSLEPAERSRIWFLGPVTREYLPVLYSSSDICIFPSLFENAPYSLLEAMCSRIPVIASNRGGIPEIITHGRNGLLFDPDNLSELITGITTLIRKPQEARSLGNQGCVDVTERFAPEKAARTTLEFYHSLMA